MKGDKNLKEIQLKNFRSLKDTELQKIAPITLLVGENSSGKSSFLRVFPLLKQSIRKRTSGPILWAGDLDDYVDFGSFEETVSNDGSNEIVFKFKFSMDELKNPLPLIESPTPQSKNIDFEITVKSKKGVDTVAFFVLKINDTLIRFNLEENSVAIDNQNFLLEKESNVSNTISKNSTYLEMFTSAKSIAFGFNLPNIESFWNKLIRIVFNDSIDNEPDNYFLFRMHSAIYALGNSLVNNEYPEQKTITNEEYESSFIRDYHNAYNTLLKNTVEDSELISIIKTCYIYLIFISIDEYIINYFGNVHYIAPLRATAERYYRLRNLAVDEIDYQGKNLAVFINSLSNKKVKDFNAWTMENFGFAINTEKSTGHLSLKIKLKDSNKAINLSDTGFGYSQILPIITQLWELSTRTIKKDDPLNDDILTPLVVAVEQPELHLHPAIQAKLTRAFIACIELAEKNGYQLQLLLETHSETIVNCLGRAVSKGILSPDDVSVILFDKHANDTKTIVTNSVFDESGYLLNWPYGFFDPED